MVFETYNPENIIDSGKACLKKSRAYASSKCDEIMFPDEEANFGMAHPSPNFFTTKLELMHFENSYETCKSRVITGATSRYVKR